MLVMMVKSIISFGVLFGRVVYFLRGLMCFVCMILLMGGRLADIDRWLLVIRRRLGLIDLCLAALIYQCRLARL